MNGYLSPDLCIGVHVDFPERDAAAHTERGLQAARQDARAQAEAEASTRPAVAAIQRMVNPSEREAWLLLAAVQALISRSGWSHTDAAIEAGEGITTATCALEAAAEMRE